jgi:antitoxin (DNA-binding transcriptional repressor) of toxin-antitoxin stability system
MRRLKITAAEFEARCLKPMDGVARTGEPVVVTERGKAVAQRVAIERVPDMLFGYMTGTVKLEGDILAPIDERWSVLSGDEDLLYEGSTAGPRSRSTRLAGRSGRKS